MLKLYVKPGCGFCRVVEEVFRQLDIDFNRKDIYKNKDHMNELEARGGKVQTPFFVDENREVEMYESEEIIKYLKEHYAKNKKVDVDTSNIPKVCMIE